MKKVISDMPNQKNVYIIKKLIYDTLFDLANHHITFLKNYNYSIKNYNYNYSIMGKCKKCGMFTDIEKWGICFYCLIKKILK